MERLVIEFVFRSVLIAGAAMVVLRALRIQSASAQHAVWTGVLMVMLALPIWVAWGPKAALPVLPPHGEPVVVMRAAPVDPAVPALTISASPAGSGLASKPAVWNWDAVWIGIYLVGAGALLLRLAVGTLHANRLTSASCAAPITVGLLRPRVILPDCSKEWPGAQFEAVLTHERAHVRRRDPLVQWLALLNRALFWFHPLAWWLEHRLTALAEEACDAAVLDQGLDPRDYSEYLLELARVVQRAGMRVNATGMAMPGSSLPQRIRKMLAGGVTSHVSPARMRIAAVACAVSSALFGAGTLKRVEPILLPALPPVAVPAPAPVLRAQAVTPRNAAPSPPAAVPKFEVVSVKTCSDADLIQGGKARGGVRQGRIDWSPGRLSANCRTLDNLIRQTYLQFPNGVPASISIRMQMQDIKGGPSWIGSDRFTIDAKAEGPQSREMMLGPMMQAILQDRFKLKIHRETREIPIYELTVANGVPKLQPAPKGGCVTLQRGDPWPESKPGEPDPVVCGTVRRSKTSEGLDISGVSMADLCHQFSVSSDRDVVDKTGIQGVFDIHLELAMTDLGYPDVAPGEPAPFTPTDGSAIRVAVRKLGLRFEPAKGSGEFLVIDHVEKPSGN